MIKLSLQLRPALRYRSASCASRLLLLLLLLLQRADWHQLQTPQQKRGISAANGIGGSLVRLKTRPGCLIDSCLCAEYALCVGCARCAAAVVCTYYVQYVALELLPLVLVAAELFVFYRLCR